MLMSTKAGQNQPEHVTKFNSGISSLKDAFKLQKTNKSEIETTGCAYESRVLEGIWAAAPYLHNGSVPSLTELLKPSAERVKSFKIGPDYDIETVGLAADQDRFNYTLNTTGCDDLNSGNSNCGHDYGTKLSSQDKKALLEYLKTL